MDDNRIRSVANEMLSTAEECRSSGDTVDPSWIEGWAKILLSEVDPAPSI